MFDRNKKYQEIEIGYAALTATVNLIIFALAAFALYSLVYFVTQIGDLLGTLTYRMPILFLLLIFGSVGITAAQTTSDEEVLRELIRREAAGKASVRYSANAVFASDALPRPVVVENAGDDETVKIQTVSAARRNQILKIQVRRIVVAESKDLAYEYSDFTISYDQPDTTRDGYTGSMLRVWHKTNGEWRIDAAFLRQNTGGENPVKN